ncbi:carbohydrate binding domain-containing protein, partial [Capnocytophaga leadbetteri]|uniref:carbohydrate binding domain-containing protein n=1 Tax=Capnocytophaga leadbetteri TaxID=327575 RepID=UPI0038B2F90B
MKKNLTMQLLPLWLLAFFFFASVPIKAQTYSEATPRIGIVKMIGCGTGTEANKAQIQVIHDGTGYSYNFGANASAQSGSTAWLPAGTHTVTVTKGSRTYKLPITVPAKVVPTFTPTVTYNCNGTADVRLTNNQGTYNYTYTYGGNTHNSPYFRDLAVGQHTITVKYTQPIAERDIVFFDDFGTKETGDPKAVRSKYAISTMNFAPLNGTQVQPNGVVINTVNLRNDACYTVATKADADTEGSPSVWLYPNDKDGKANGRYLYYDAHTVNQNLYTRKAKVKPNTPVNFSAYLFNTVKSSYNSAYTVRVTLDIYANEAAAQAGTAPLFRSYYFNVPTATTDADKWYPINVTANIGGSYSELVFVVRMYGDSLNGGIGNDIALDNVLVTQPTAICEQTVDVPVNVVTNTNTYSTTVTYNCAANNATIKVTPSVTTGYTYTYKLDNGTAGSNNTFNNVAVGVHTLTLTSQYTGAKVIFKEDFGSGAPYRLPETVVPRPFVCKDVLYGYPADILAEGHYQVANVNNLTQMNTWNWRSPKDHTNSADGQGRYLAFNYGANANKTFYKQDIRVEANKPVTVEYYAYNINQNSTVALPAIKVTLVNKATNSTVHTSSTYTVIGNASDTDWKKVTFTFTPPVNARDLELNFINEENSEGSNDFAIDDILVTQAYDTCSATVTATVAPKVTRAFAGVTKLIGCGTGANANKAEVTIANVEGGSGAYEYNFGGTWTTTNAGWLAAGTHTVSVRAVGTGNSCQYDMSVTVPAAIAQPTIKTAVHYACDGKAILNIGVENPDPEIKYLYSLDGAAYTTTYIFNNIATGTHQVSVQYEYRTITSADIVFKDDFGHKNAATPDRSIRSPHINKAYFFENFTGTQVNGNGTTRAGNTTTDGCYMITTPADSGGNNYRDFDKDPNGRVFWVNIGNVLGASGAVLYQRQLPNIKPGRDIVFSISAYNTIGSSAPTLADPIISIDLYKNLSDIAAHSPFFTSGQITIPKNTHPDDWHTYSYRVSPGANTSFYFVIRSYSTETNGNDLALDNLILSQMPAACGQVVSATTNVTTNPVGVPTFNANISNCSNTNSTITWVASPTTGYTYTYTIQGGTATSSNVFNGLAMGTYTFTINYCGTTDTSTVIFKEDFGAGNITSSPYVPIYDAAKANTPDEGYRYISNADLQVIEGGYAVTPAVLLHNTLWQNPVDKSGKTNGRFLAFNIGKGEVIYKREIQVIPNRNLKFEFYIFNFEKASNHRNVGRPNVKMSLLTTSGTAIASKISGEVTENTGANDWRKFEGSLNTGNNNRVILEIRTLTSNPVGNDMAIDDIIITQEPIICTTTVTATVQNQVQKAFAGVTKLIGCGTGANANKAEVTIANVEGGSGTYEYQFDGLTWTASNTGWLSAGTHTVSVRDSVTKSCAYDMSVTVPAALAQPTIKTAVHYACDGKAILNIGVENPDPALKYLYSLDGAAYTSTYLYTNVASGTHSVSVQYEHRSTPSPMLLWREDFGTGDPTTNASVNSSDFTFRDPRTNSVGGYGDYTVAAYKDLASPNQFEVARGVTYPTNPAAVWRPVFKGTTTGANDDRYLYVDMANNTYDKVFMEKEVIIDPHNLIEFSYQIRSYDAPVIYLGSPIENPNMQIRIVEATNPSNVLGAINSGKIPHDGAWHLVSSKNMGTINPNGVTRIKIQFINKEPSSWGNDLAIDDITVWQTPKACGQVVSTTKVVTANNQDIPAFTVSKTYDCATGKGALTVTPTATTGFTYTYTLGSTTYTSTTATFTGLDLEQTYTVSVSYQAVSNTITLLNEDFGAGTTPIRSPYVGKNLYFNENTSAAYTSYNANGQSRAHAAGTFLKEEEYCIADHIAIRSYDWDNPSDHTGKTNGRMLYINGISAVPTQEVYARQVNVVPNLPLTFTTSFYNLIRNVLVVSPNTPRVNIALYESEAAYRANANNVITQTTILDIPSTGNKWETQTITLTAAQVANRTTMYAVVRMHNVLSAGHDLAVDDIVITQKLPACTTSVTATLTKGDVATPTLTLPANLSVICSAPTASATISSWIASATATSTCGTATVTHNYSYPSNLCNVSGGAVTVTFSTTDPFGNVVTATRVISFATMTLTVTPTTLSVPNGALGGTTSSVVPNITLGGVASPSTNSVTITFSGLPTGVTSTTGGRLIVAPNTPAGSHTITYRVCETAGHNNCKTVNTQLVIGTGSLTVTPVTPLTVPNGISGGTTSSVLTGITLNGATVTNTNSVTISFSGLPTGVTSNTNGQLVIPAGTPAGTHTITYRVCEKLNPTNCHTVTSTLVIGTGSLTVTPVMPLTVPNGISGGTTSSVLTGITLNGATVTNTNSVTISFSGLPTGVTSNTNGQLVIPAGTPAGTHTITYRVCEKLNPTNCHTVTSTLVIGTGSLTVTPVMPLTVPNGISGGTTSSVLTGITLNGTTVTNTNSVTISFSGLPTG